LDKRSKELQFLQEKKEQNEGKVGEPTSKQSVASNMVTPETNEWSDINDVFEFPTNAYGLIDFINEDEGSEKPSKYIRVSDNTPMSKIQVGFFQKQM
jgi:hypothetical protein